MCPTQAPQELLVAVKNLDTQQRQQIQAKQSHAERKLKDVVKLIVEPETAEDLGAEISKSAAGLVRGSCSSKSYALIIFDGKLLCESGTQTKYRPAPTRLPQVTKLLSGVLAARQVAGEMTEGDLIIAADGGKGKDFEDKVEKVVSAVQHTTTKQVINYTCESAEKRMERDHGGMLELMETILIIGKTAPTVVKRSRKNFPGQSTRSKWLGPVDYPDWDDTTATWHLNFKTKKALYGAHNRPRPGQECPVEHDPATRITSLTKVPVFYQEFPASIPEEFVHTFKGCTVIDLTPGQGHWAMASLRSRIPYVGVCFTEDMVQLLYGHLINRTLQAMLDEKDDLYDVVLKNLAKAGAEAPSEPPNDDGDKTVKRGRGRGRGRGRAGRGRGAVGGVDARAALLARLKASQDVQPGDQADEDEEEDGDGEEVE